MTFDICSQCNVSQQIVCLSLYLLSVQRHPWQSSTVVSIKDAPVATFLVHIDMKGNKRLPVYYCDFSHSKLWEGQARLSK